MKLPSVLTAAQQAALSAFLTANPGLTQDDATCEDLEQYGFVASDPTSGMPAPAPAITDAQEQADEAALAAEAQSNTTGAQILTGIENAAEAIVPLAKAAAL